MLTLCIYRWAMPNRVLAIRGLAGWGTARLLYMIDLLKWTYGLSLNGIRETTSRMRRSAVRAVQTGYAKTWDML